jgi:hypothetical protein
MNARLTALFLHSFTCPDLECGPDNIDDQHQRQQDKSDKYGQLGPEQGEHQPGGRSQIDVQA